MMPSGYWIGSPVSREIPHCSPILPDGSIMKFAPEPIVASRTERTILHDMGQDAAAGFRAQLRKFDGQRMILARLSRAIREQNWFAVALEFVIVIAGDFDTNKAKGLLQVKDQTARHYEADPQNLFDPVVNVTVGSRQLDVSRLRATHGYVLDTDLNGAPDFLETGPGVELRPSDEDPAIVTVHVGDGGRRGVTWRARVAPRHGTRPHRRAEQVVAADGPARRVAANEPARRRTTYTPLARSDAPPVARPSHTTR